MLSIYFSTNFKKDYKRVIKQGKDKKEFEKVVSLLQKRIPLPPKYNDHALTGTYIAYRECHIKLDWLLIYKIDTEKLLLVLIRIGSRSDLF